MQTATSPTLWGGSSADRLRVVRSLKLDKAECEATHAQASQMLRRFGLDGEPVTRRRSCASRCSCWPTPSPSPWWPWRCLLAVLTSVAGCAGRGGGVKTFVERSLSTRSLASFEPLRRRARENASTFAVNAISYFNNFRYEISLPLRPCPQRNTHAQV